MTTFPTDGVKKPEWVSDSKNRCRITIICEPEFNLRGLTEKISPQRHGGTEKTFVLLTAPVALLTR